jgi:serine O-acetyltransferase
MTAQIFYRTGNWFYKRKIPLIPSFFKYLIRILNNCAIDPKTKIGRNTVFGYGGIGLVIHKGAIIGENCVISQNVTIGGKQSSLGAPRIGNNVQIGAGAVILGDLIISDNSVIGANAVVVKNVELNNVVAGVPGKVIRVNK